MTDLDALYKELKKYPEDVRPVMKILLANREDLINGLISGWEFEQMILLARIARYILAELSRSKESV